MDTQRKDEWKHSWRGVKERLCSESATERDLKLRMPMADTGTFIRIISFALMVLGLSIFGIFLLFLDHLFLGGWFAGHTNLPDPILSAIQWHSNSELSTVVRFLTLAITFMLWYRYAWRRDRYLAEISPASKGGEFAIEFMICVAGFFVVLALALDQIIVWVGCLVPLVLCAGFRYQVARRNLLLVSQQFKKNLIYQLNTTAILPEKFAFGLAWTEYVLLLFVLTIACRSTSVVLICLSALVVAQAWYNFVGKPLGCARRFLRRIDDKVVDLYSINDLLPKYPPWVDQLARFTSIAFSPFLSPLGLFLPAAFAFSASKRSALTSTSIMAATGIVLPFVVAARGVIAKKLSDLHLGDRAQRPPFLLLCVGFVFAGLLLLWLAGSPRMVEIYFSCYGATLAVLAIISCKTKVSAHCAAIAGLIPAIYFISQRWSLLPLWALLLVSWARIRREKHTLPQCCLGAAVGFSVVLLIIWLSYSFSTVRSATVL